MMAYDLYSIYARHSRLLMAAHVDAGLCNNDNDEVRIWHILYTLLHMCDRRGLSIDVLLAEAREDYKVQIAGY